MYELMLFLLCVVWLLELYILIGTYAFQCLSCHHRLLECIIVLQWYFHACSFTAAAKLFYIVYSMHMFCAALPLPLYLHRTYLLGCFPFIVGIFFLLFTGLLTCLTHDANISDRMFGSVEKDAIWKMHQYKWRPCNEILTEWWQHSH